MNEKTGVVSHASASSFREALPNAFFIGFSGTAIELKDANTRLVFGDDISTSGTPRPVPDQGTGRIYYESRIAKLSFSVSRRPKFDAPFDEITEGEEFSGKE